MANQSTESARCRFLWVPKNVPTYRYPRFRSCPRRRRTMSAAVSTMSEQLGMGPPESPGSASIIEILALDKLMPALRLAAHYVLTVAAQRHPSIFLRFHHFRDEVYLGFAAVMEAHSLATSGASFGETFYGLYRRPTASEGGRERKVGVSATSRLAVVLLVLMPYLRNKVDEYPRLGDARGRERLEAAEAEEHGGSSDHGQGEAPSSRTSERVAWRVLRLLCRVLCASLDASELAQLLLFTFGRSQYATLSQRILGYTLQRAPPLGAPSPPVPAASKPAAAAAASAASATPSASSVLAPAAAASASSATQPASAPSVALALRRLGSLADVPLRHARHVLLLSVFGYRLLEWWHAPDNAVLPAPKLIPPPPPPPPLLPGIELPEPGLCGVCRMPPRQPTAASSGYVLCAACAKAAVRRDGRCPLTGMPMRLEDLIRIYETSRPEPAN